MGDSPENVPPCARHPASVAVAPVRSQALRSRRAIKQALLSLMDNEQIASISITELAACAGVARRTFHRHFSSVEEVFSSLMEDAARSFTAFYIKELARRGHTFENAVYLHFLYWSEHRPLLSAACANNRFYAVMDAVCAEMLRVAWSAGLLHDEEEAVAFRFCAGGIWMLVERWVQEDFPHTPEEMACVCRSIPKKMR